MWYFTNINLFLQMVVMDWLVMSLMTLRTINCCSYFSLFDYRYALTKDEYKYNYTVEKLNTFEPEDAKEEAIMLIGGIFLTYIVSISDI